MSGDSAVGKEAATELKPCPFGCARAPEVVNHYSVPGPVWGVICYECGAYQDTRSDDEAGAIEAWNRRVASTAPQAANGEVDARGVQSCALAIWQAMADVDHESEGERMLTSAEVERVLIHHWPRRSFRAPGSSETAAPPTVTAVDMILALDAVQQRGIQQAEGAPWRAAMAAELTAILNEDENGETVAPPEREREADELIEEFRQASIVNSRLPRELGANLRFMSADHKLRAALLRTPAPREVNEK